VETVIQLGHFVDSYRIDPSRVVQLSWQPRSGILMDFFFFFFFFFDCCIQWQMIWFDVDMLLIICIYTTYRDILSTKKGQSYIAFYYSFTYNDIVFN